MQIHNKPASITITNYCDQGNQVNINCYFKICSRAGVPKLRDTMADDLRWN